jgi:hypothetical protein
MLLSRKTFRCYASAEKKENNIVAARKLFEAKRSVSLKENVNKLIQIATADSKEVNDFLKELDVLHKKEINSIFPNSTPAPTTSSSEDENPFLNE